MIITQINEQEFIKLLNDNNINIPIYSDKEAIECYSNHEIIKVSKKNISCAVFLIPIDNNGVRRKFRFFPYCMPILLYPMNNKRTKDVYKSIFNYIFNKYDYSFIPLHPDFNIVSSLSSEAGFVEMRHTHRLSQKLDLDNMNGKLRNHIKSALSNIKITIDTNYSDFDFNEAIKGNKQEVKERTKLAKKLLKNNKGFLVKALLKNEVIAGIMIIFDKQWAYLLHSYQKEKIRGAVPLMILEATKICFDEKNVTYFDFEGSVIDEIDDFFSSFDANIITFPYLIHSKNKEKLYELIDRSININGRIKKYEKNSN